MDEINLKFNKTLTTVVGNRFGNETFETQVKNKINYKHKTKIIFPKEVERVAISFVQGFTNEIVKKIGKKRLKELIIFETSSDKLTKKIDDNIG